MKWKGEYVVDNIGQCRWSESLCIHDSQIINAYRNNALVEFTIESSAIMGVKVGVA
jgi:hypothetical protein